jgi:hypothetical protein
MSYTQVQKFKLVRFISLVSRTISRDNIPPILPSLLRGKNVMAQVGTKCTNP